MALALGDRRPARSPRRGPHWVLALVLVTGLAACASTPPVVATPPFPAAALEGAIRARESIEWQVDRFALWSLEADVSRRRVLAGLEGVDYRAVRRSYGQSARAWNDLLDLLHELLRGRAPRADDVQRIRYVAAALAGGEHDLVLAFRSVPPMTERDRYFGLARIGLADWQIRALVTRVRQAWCGDRRGEPRAPFVAARLELAQLADLRLDRLRW